jgi:threonine/homoserine/homoserine lactone efflux protein
MLIEANAMSSALSILTAMITPAVLISACGTMILSTSTRLGRVVDRVRALSDRFEELASNAQPDMKLYEERRKVIFNQLDKLTSRARLLQRCMTIFYMALGIFVLTSVAIGVVAVSGATYNWIPVVFGILGACFLFYGSVLLIFEARLALSTIHAEMDFIWQLGKQLAPAELVEQHKPNRVHFRRHHP